MGRAWHGDLIEQRAIDIKSAESGKNTVQITQGFETLILMPVGCQEVLSSKSCLLDLNAKNITLRGQGDLSRFYY